MRLVDDHQRRVRNAPPGEGLHRRHLNPGQGIGAGMVRLHHPDPAHALGLEGSDGLVDQAHRGRGEDHRVALGHGSLDDPRGDERLAEADRTLKHDPTIALAKR